LPIEEALATLRLRLLDLTSRNRLLNFKHSPGKSLQLVDSSPDKVFAKLLINQGAAVAVNPVPEPDRDRWVRVNNRLTRPDVREHAKHCGIKTSYDLQPDAVEGGAVRALYYPDDLARHCRKLAREARSAIEETGANMLFLVVGFLEFPDKEDNGRSLTAPLISVPVSLDKTRVDRETGQECFVLKYTGEDLAENLSLREKLSQEYSFELPEFDDEAGPEAYFRQLDGLIARKPRWNVKRHMTIALLSFSKMLLVRDIDPRNWPVAQDGASALMEHAIVRMVFEGAPNDGGGTSAVAPEHKIDGHALQNLPLIYDADSSQHSALIDALTGKNLVVEGPPGTGKSQTITNLIAAALAEGKTVLFVSEKLAALEVVKKRLKLAGLEHFCLELHSNKTQKKHVLEELEKRRDARFAAPPGLPAKLKTLEEKRQQLAGYAELLNGVHGNVCGLTVHQVLWRAERHRQACQTWEATQELYIADAPSSDEAAFQSRYDALGGMASQYRELGGYGPDHPYWGLFVEDLLPGTDLQIERTLSEFLPKFRAMVSAVTDAAAFLQSTPLHISATTAAKLLDVLAAITPANHGEMAQEMLPRIFIADDLEGRCAQATLTAFQDKLAKVATLRSYVDGRLLARESLSENDGFLAAQVEAGLDGLRLLAMTAQQLHAMHVELSSAIAAADAALKKVEVIGEAVGQSYQGDTASMRKIAANVESAAAAPRELLGFRHPALVRPNTLQLLGRARSEFEALSREAGELDELFYLDTIEGTVEISTAITTLRQGHTWYRVFQSSWRRACVTHRTIAKSKTRKAPSVRLQELERLHSLLKNTKQWKESREYREVLGPFHSDTEPEFDNAQRLAQWRAEAYTRLVNAGLDGHADGLLDGDETRLVQVAGLNEEFKNAADALNKLQTFLSSQFQTAPAVGAELEACERWSQRMDIAKSIDSALTQALASLVAWASPTLTAFEVLRAVKAWLELPHAISAVEADQAAKMLLGDLYSGPETNLAPALAALTYGRNVLKARLPAPITRVLLADTASENHRTLSGYLLELQQGWQAITDFDARLRKLAAFELEAWAGEKTDSSNFAHRLVERTANAIANRERLLPWVQYLQAAARARERGLGDFVDCLESGAVAADDLADAYGYRFFGSIAHALFTSHQELSRFAGVSHEKARSEYAALDRDIIRLRGAECANKAWAHADAPAGRRSAIVGEKTEMELLNHMVAHPRARVTVRRMLSQAGRAVQALKPCFMMGPQAVAQYLDPTAGLKFDIVVMDEASQLKPEEAIGAVARGSQLIVVGDPKQLPPTTFFDRLGMTSDDGEEHAAAVGSESILDVCMGHFHPVRTLRWHYRSRHESLITFSNNHFYRNRLIVFPSPYGKSKRLGLRYRYIEGAVYESQMNRAEAARVVDAAIDHMVNHADDSLGIVTLNLKQRDLIEELLDQRCRSLPRTDEFRAQWEGEGLGLFVKNLESVQGDERDVIFISTTFGKAPNTDVVRQNFGPISRQTGWRRLNVLFTRARKSVHLFSSMLPEDIVVDEGTPRGTKALREYLEFARSGVLAEVGPTGEDAESDFEVAVTEVLEDAGYSVVPQLGVAGYRIDLAVKHPKYPSAYLAAIECDGASYHSSVSVRDRDRIRQEILESLGWDGRIWRIWSTDWFRNPHRETNRMLDFLKRLVEKPLPDVYVAEEEEVPPARREPAVTRQAERPAFALEAAPRTKAEPKASQASLDLAQTTVIVEEDGEEDLQVEVGDLVTYVPLATPDQEVSVRITSTRTAIDHGLIAETTPLAQALLGAVVDDEVVLRVPAKPAQSFIVKKIVRSHENATIS
jgi:transcription elongation GreA/GreB family factor/very-short-patch-repair endonuclease